MQVQLHPTPNMTIIAEGQTQTEIFEELARMQEVFGKTKCGKCGSEETRFVVREDKEENKYYEIWCEKCRAKLAFGCHKKGGGLFPKTKDGDKYLPDGGWLKWNKDKGIAE